MIDIELTQELQEKIEHCKASDTFYGVININTKDELDQTKVFVSEIGFKTVLERHYLVKKPICLSIGKSTSIGSIKAIDEVNNCFVFQYANENRQPEILSLNSIKKVFEVHKVL